MFNFRRPKTDQEREALRNKLSQHNDSAEIFRKIKEKHQMVRNFFNSSDEVNDPVEELKEERLEALKKTNNNSYGLLLEDIPNDEDPAASGSKGSPRTLARDFSPVEIQTLSSEEINDPLLSFPKRRESLVNTVKVTVESALTASTPFVGRHRSQPFFPMDENVTAGMSPIQKPDSEIDQNESSSKSQREAMPPESQHVPGTPQRQQSIPGTPRRQESGTSNAKQTRASSRTSQSKLKQVSFQTVQVKSMAAIDDNLQALTLNPVDTIPARNSSRVPVRSRSSSRSSIGVRFTPVAKGLESMDLDQEMALSESRTILSQVNQTDNNTIAMIETPVVHAGQPRALAKCDSRLAEKLLQCEVSDDDSDMENEEPVINTHVKPAMFRKKPEKKPTSKGGKAKSKQFESFAPEAQDAEEEMSQKRNDGGVNKKSRSKQQEDRNETSASEQDEEDESTSSVPTSDVPTEVKSRPSNVEMPPPPGPLQKDSNDEVNLRSVSLANSTSFDKNMPSPVVHSFRSISRKRTVSDTEPQPISTKIIEPQKRRRLNQVSSATQSYLNLTDKKTRGARNTAGRRHLYSGDFSSGQETTETSGETKSSEAFSDGRETIKTSGQVQCSAQTSFESFRETDSENHIPASNVQSETEESGVEVSSGETDQVEEDLEVHPDDVGKGRSKGKPARKSHKSVAVPRSLRSRKNVSGEDPVEIEQEADDVDEESETAKERPDNFLYDPYERGCKREGLRIRTYSRPYWIHNADRYKYGIVYGTLTNKNKATYATKALTSRRNVFATDSPVTKKRKKSGNPASRKPASSVISGASSSATHSGFDNFMQKVATAQSLQDIQFNNPVAKGDGYTIADMAKVCFTNCGEGLFYGQFTGHNVDGVLKLIPGGKKRKSRSRSADLKFHVLQGVVDVRVNGQTHKLSEMTYINIERASYYQLQNNGAQDVVMIFTK